MRTSDIFYVVTGGPGVGKTSLINELEKKGYNTMPEIARQIIKDQTRNNGTAVPWKDKALYAELMLKASVESYSSIKAENTSSIYFFDRGIPDTLCYADMIGLGISDQMVALANACRYNRRVFILPPWHEIYTTDDERKQTWEEAVQTFYKLKATYQKLDYEVIEVPKDTVINRVKFIEQVLKSGDSLS